LSKAVPASGGGGLGKRRDPSGDGGIRPGILYPGGVRKGVMLRILPFLAVVVQKPEFLNKPAIKALDLFNNQVAY
jgi:hypothetical protein